MTGPSDRDFDDLYAAGGGAPRERLPEGERDPRVAYSLVHDELMLDGV